MKQCSKCLIEKEDSEFSKRGNGLQNWCKICSKEHKRKWLENNRHKARINAIWTKYRLRIEDYDKLLLSQDNRCKICLEKFMQTPHIDHNHSTNIVRGILCQKCNHLVGWVEKHKDLLPNVIQYIG